MKAKDARISCTSEALTNIKTLKLYSWTNLFEESIHQKRKVEMDLYRKVAIIDTLIITSLYFFPSILSSVVFTTYIGFGHQIDLASAFTVLVFFDLIKNPIRTLPLFITEYLDMKVSIVRLQSFIDADEVDGGCLVT